MLAYLAFSGRWVSRSQLAFLFWPDMPEEQARTNLRQRLKQVQQLRWCRGLEAEAGRLRWAVSTDVRDFCIAAERGAWQDAVACYQGPLLAGLLLDELPAYEEWVEVERERLETAFRRAAISRAAELERETRHGDTVLLLRRVLDSDPLAEDVVQAYLRAAYLAGSRSDALALYAAFRGRLKVELGLEPLEETVNLADSLRAAETLRMTAIPRADPPPAWLLHPPRLVGREGDLTAALGATTPVVLIAGEPGVGKSHLAEVLAPEALRLNFLEGLQTLPYAPIVEHIRIHQDALPDLGQYRDDLSRLVPELTPDRPLDRPDPGLAKARLLEALTRYALSGFRQDKGTFALLLDDLQWADRASLEWLSYLTLTKHPAVLGTFRVGEVGPALGRFLSAQESSGSATVLKLEPLTLEAAATLVADFSSDGAVPEDFLKWLFEKSGGNPFFLLQLLKSLVETGDLVPSQSGWRFDVLDGDPPTLELPDKIAALVRRRVARLGDATRRALEAASVVREGFDEANVAPLAGLSEQALTQALGQAEWAGMIRNRRFVHDLLRESLYSAIPATTRRFWHKKVAEQTEDPLQAAEHWWHAGEPARAVAGWLAGARSLSGRGLMQEAAETLERALTYGPQERKAHAWLAQVYLHGARFDEAETEALQLTGAGNSPTERLWGVATLADLALRKGRSLEAFRMAKQGLALLADVGESDRPPGVIATFSTMLSIHGEHATAVELLEARLAQGTSDRLEAAYLLNAKGFALDHQERHVEAKACFQAALHEARALGARHLEVHVLVFAVFCSLMALEKDSLDEVRADAERALALGSYQYTPLLKIHLSYLQTESGRLDEALRLVEDVLERHHDVNFRTLAAAHKVRVLAMLGREAHREVEAALAMLDTVDFPNTRASILSVALDHGDPGQRRRALAEAKLVPVAHLLPYFRKRFVEALERLRR